jgi:hypothetical protein
MGVSGPLQGQDSISVPVGTRSPAADCSELLQIECHHRGKEPDCSVTYGRYDRSAALTSVSARNNRGRQNSQESENMGETGNDAT